MAKMFKFFLLFTHQIGPLKLVIAVLILLSIDVVEGEGCLGEIVILISCKRHRGSVFNPGILVGDIVLFIQVPPLYSLGKGVGEP